MMNYRQWKKKYKKLHGYNPSMFDDRRKRTKSERIQRAIRTKVFTSVCAQSILSLKHLPRYSDHTYMWLGVTNHGR